MNETIRLSLFAGALTLLLAAVPGARAQLVQGIGGGLTAAGPSRNGSLDAERYHPGFTARVFIGPHASRRLATRFDLSISRFSAEQMWFVLADCWGLCPVNGPSESVGIAALTANAIATLIGPNRGGQLYLIGGIGPYYVYRTSGVGNEVRLGTAFGAGWVLPWGRRSRAFLEARYERLVDSPVQLEWMAPITVGLRF